MGATRSNSESTSGPGRALRLALLAVAAAALWMAFVANTELDEKIIGIAVVVLATLFVAKTVLSVGVPTEFRAKDLIQCWRIPWYMASKVAQIIWILLRDLAGVRRAGSHYRYCGFRTSKRNPELIARSVLEVAYTTAAPNFLIIGIDPEQNHMLFHQLERTTISSMTKALGAQQ